MSEAFNQLLGATIGHLEQLRDQGVRHVAVSPDTWAALNRPAPRREPRPQRPPVAAPVTAAPAVPTSALKLQETASPNPRPTPSQANLALPSEAPKAGAPALSPEARAAAMAALRARALACQKCPNLAAARRQVVFGVGDIHSPLVFVGEAPGADEDVQGEPFVGKAGQLLTKIIQAMGLSRETVYIANILKCRPDTPGQASGNRKPTADEMKTCSPYLIEQIDLIQPKVLVALGATAVEGLLGATAGITRLRGHWQQFRGIPVMPTYHPAYLLRNQSLQEKRKVWEDMMQVLERLGLPITEKQRGFFLTAKPS